MCRIDSEEAVEETVQRLRDLFRELEIDDHRWQARHCPTCKAVSKELGRHFGCESKRHGKLRRGGKL